jgi:hypothetical protein
MPDKIVNQEIRVIEGQPCLVFIGTDGRDLFIPAQAMQAVFDNAKSQFNAFSAQHGLKAGQWSPAIIVTPQTWNTGTTDAGKVAIIVDRGLRSEQTLALSSDHASQLGQQLLETARSVGQPPKMN